MTLYRGKSLDDDSLLVFSNQIFEISFNSFTFVYHTQLCTNFVPFYLVHSSELLRYLIYRAHPYGPYGGKVLSDVTLHLAGVFINFGCRSIHVGAGLAH